jgi:hypothetical protein
MSHTGRWLVRVGIGEPSGGLSLPMSSFERCQAEVLAAWRELCLNRGLPGFMASLAMVYVWVAKHINLLHRVVARRRRTKYVFAL